MNIIQYTKNKSPLPLLFLVILLLQGLSNLPVLLKSIFLEREGEFEFSTVVSEIESEYLDGFVGKEWYLYLNGIISSTVDAVEMNGVVKLNNDHLHIVVFQENVENNVQKVHEFQNLLKNQQIPYLYVQTPCKLENDYDLNLPTGYVSYENSNADLFLQGLQEENIDFVDLREEVKAENLEFSDLFFKTDHHWRVETAFWATPFIVESVNAHLGIPVEDFFFDLEEYQVETYENMFLGAFGERTGIAFSEKEDFSVILPEFHTDFRLEIPSSLIDISGNFQEVFLATFQNEDIQYESFLFGNQDMTKITNLNAKNDTVIFLLKDSFSLPLACFLASHYKELYLFDLRTGIDLERPDIFTKVEEINPDLVLQVLSPSEVGNEEHFFYG